MDRAWAVWLALGVLLGPAEAVTRKLFFGPASVGALAAGEPLRLQAAMLAVIAGAGLASRAMRLRPYLRAVARHGMLRGTARVTEEVSGNAGRVRYGGANWAARSSGTVIAPGAKVGVAGLADDATLRVYPAEAALPTAKALLDAPVARVSWREASAARGRLSGGYLLTPDERLRADVEVEDGGWPGALAIRQGGVRLLEPAGLGRVFDRTDDAEVVVAAVFDEDGFDAAAC